MCATPTHIPSHTLAKSFSPIGGFFHSSDVWASFVQFRWMTEIIYHSPYVRLFLSWRKSMQASCRSQKNAPSVDLGWAFTGVRDWTPHRWQQKQMGVHCLDERNMQKLLMDILALSFPLYVRMASLCLCSSNAQIQWLNISQSHFLLACGTDS